MINHRNKKNTNVAKTERIVKKRRSQVKNILKSRIPAIIQLKDKMSNAKNTINNIVLFLVNQSTFFCFIQVDLSLKNYSYSDYDPIG